MSQHGQPRIYMARIANPVGDYHSGDIVEVSRAPADWQIAGTKSAGWIVTSVGRKPQWISNECAMESLTSIRNPAGAPYRVDSPGALCRRAGYVRHMNAHIRSRRSVPQAPPALFPTAVTEAEALANGIRLGITGDELDAYIYLAVKPNCQLAKVLQQTT